MFVPGVDILSNNNIYKNYKFKYADPDWVIKMFHALIIEGKL